MPNKIEPTKQDLEMVEKFMEETGQTWAPPAEFAASSNAIMDLNGNR